MTAMTTQNHLARSPPPFRVAVFTCVTVREIDNMSTGVMWFGQKSWQSYFSTAKSLGRRADGEASGSPHGPPKPLIPYETYTIWSGWMG
jgi:hypothetical protein